MASFPEMKQYLGAGDVPAARRPSRGSQVLRDLRRLACDTVCSVLYPSLCWDNCFTALRPLPGKRSMEAATTERCAQAVAL